MIQYLKPWYIITTNQNSQESKTKTFINPCTLFVNLDHKTATKEPETKPKNISNFAQSETLKEKCFKS